MNKKFATYLMISTVTFGTCATVLFLSNNAEFQVKANETNNVLRLNSNNKMTFAGYFGFEAEGGTVYYNPDQILTENHNAIYFKRNGFDANSCTFTNGVNSWFANYLPINGLTSITAIGDFDFTVSYGYGPESYDVENIPLQSGTKYDFDGNHPSYFRLKSASEENNHLNSMVLEFSCDRESNPFNDNYLVYEFNNATLEENKGYIVKNSTTNYSKLAGDIVIKDKYDDGEHGEYPVISVSESMFSRSVTPFVKSVYFPDSITSYGNYLFSSNLSLKSVRLSPNARALSYRMFYNCERLESIDIPNTVHTIGGAAFVECNAITTLVIPDSVTTIDTDYNYGCFQGMDNLKNVTWSAGLTDFGHFAGTGLETIVIPDTVTTVLSSAFRNCPYLRHVVVGANVTLIGTGAFKECKALETVDFSRNNKLLTLNTDAFRDCWVLDNVVLPDSVTTIGGSAFRFCKGLTSIKLSKNLVTIGDYSFNGCTSLESITIPSKATDLLFEAFDYCTALNTVVFEEGTTEVENNFFTYCYALENVVLASTITYIGSGAFEQCTSLTSINLPAKLSTLRNRAFANCTNLTTVNYAGTMLGWSQINKEDNSWYIGTQVTVVHCSDGDVQIA